MKQSGRIGQARAGLPGAIAQSGKKQHTRGIMNIDKAEVEKLRREAQKFPEFSLGEIEASSQALEGFNYSPTLLIPTPNFIHFTKEDLLGEIDRLAGACREDIEKELGIEEKNGQDLGEIVLRHLKLLVYHYHLLVRLRKNDPKAWDEINELYEEY